MITLCIITIMLTLGVMIYSLDNDHPKLIIMLEILAILISIGVIVHILLNPIEKPTVPPSGPAYYTTTQKELYMQGYKQGLIDCNNINK